MRAPKRPSPLLATAVALLAAAHACAHPAHAAHNAHAAPTERQTYIVCKGANSHICLAWPHSPGRLVIDQRARRCGITTGNLLSHRLQAVRLSELKDGAKGVVEVYCVVMVMEGGALRARRQVGRGRYRGQTQSQYLAVDRGGADDGKAEAHSAPDSSSASVSGNSGMGQAQSQSMYDASCDDCYGTKDAGASSSQQDHFRPNSISGYRPAQSWSYPGSRDTPLGSQPNSESGTYGPLTPGKPGYQYYNVPGSNNIIPRRVAAGDPDQSNDFSPGQSRNAQGTGPGQADFRETYRPDTLVNSGNLRPGQAPLVAVYAPGQQGYGGFQPNPPATLVEPDNSLRNRYEPSQNNGIRNYGLGLTGNPQGESYLPGSQISTPIRGPGRLGGIGTSGDTQPNQGDIQSRYNTLKPPGNSYRETDNIGSGNYGPEQNVAFTPTSDNSFANQNPGNVIPGSQGPYTGSGVYNQNQPGPLNGLVDKAPRGNANQGTIPAGSYGPNQIGSNNLLVQPQGGKWPLASYSPGSSPYFCCVVGPDGNIVPSYAKDSGVSNGYPVNNNQAGFGGLMQSSGSNGSPNGQGYVLNPNVLPRQQQSYALTTPNRDTSLFKNDQDSRQGILNQNGYYGPPANMGLLPGGQANYRPDINSPPGSGINLNQNTGIDNGRFSPRPGISNNEILYKPSGSVESGNVPSLGNNRDYSSNGGPGNGHYSPDQGNSGIVGTVIPGHIRPYGIGSGNMPAQNLVHNSGGSYGPGTNIGNGFPSNIPENIRYPDQSGSIGNNFSPQQSGSSGPDGKIMYVPNSNMNPESNLNYNSNQNPSRDGGNYLPIPGAGYTPNNGGVSYSKSSNAGPNGYNFPASSEPGNYGRFGQGPNNGQDVYPNSLYGSGTLGPGQNNIGNVGDYRPDQGLGEKSTYGPSKDGMLVQPVNYAPGTGSQQSIYGPGPINKYGIGSVGNEYDPRLVGQNKEYSGIPQNVTDPNMIIADGDDSEAEATVSQAANGTTASASSRGGNDKGRAQTNVHGTYTGSGSFSAQAQITGENKEAESEVSGGKKGASSSAQGSGRNNKSQANVQLGSETGSVQTQSLTNGAYHSSNSQVQGSVKGGMADAQARGPGSTSSQAQIGFTPYKEGEKAHDKQKIPFVGGGVASAQSNGRTGQSQSQLHGTFKYGITYNGAAQSGASVDKDAVFPNRLPFEKIDVFDENEKNINVDAEKSVTSVTDPSTTAEPEPPVESLPSEESLPSAESIPKLSNLVPVETDESNDKVEESLKDSESRYSSHTHLDHHKVQPTSSLAIASEGTRNFPSNHGNNGPDDEYTTDREDAQTDEYDTEGADVEQGEYSNYDDIPREPLTHQSLQSPRKPVEVKQTMGGNTQHIVLDSLENHDAEITQRNSERPDETKTYLPGERVPGTGGYTIPAGFTGIVKSVASKEKTYVVGSRESPSQAQTVTLTPGGTGRVRYRHAGEGRPVSAGKLRSLQAARPRTDRYLTVSKSVARDLDAEDHVRKQYSHSYYTKSSSCGFFTFTCTMVSGAEGSKKVCKPKVPTNPDGTPIRC